MPTYRCTAPEGLLDPQRRAALASAITRTHSAVTGAASYFAQVLFEELPRGRYFVGAAPLNGGQIFVHGHIRAGRSAGDRARLVSELIAAVAAAAGLKRRNVWVYLAELPAHCMAEYGRVLPEPGGEQAWLDEFSAEDRAFVARGAE